MKNPIREESMPARRTKSGPASWRLSSRWLVAMMLVIVAGFSIICGSVLLNMRRAAWELARHGSENLAATLDADISRNIELYDLSLRAVAANMALPEINEVSPAIRHLIRFDHAATAKHFGQVRVFGSNGRLIVDSATLHAPDIEAAGAEYFVAHQADAAIGLLISRPATDSSGEYSLRLSRRISAADGSFGGVVVGSIRLSYFHDLFRRVKAGTEDSLTLIQKGGFVVMRSPFDIGVIGKDLSYSPGIRRTESEETGWVEAAGVDGITRQYVWRDGGQPLVMLVGKSLNSIYGPWRSDALGILLAISVLAAMAVGAAVLLAREMRMRNHFEQKLAVLATTDGLTGLNNRRQFDEVLQAEWQRSLRSKAPLALLMIDADHFKAFNDLYGHQAGDKVLAEVAACIAAEARRSSDCPARYGGEEFSVILPGAAADAACIVAERIRTKIEKLSWDGTHITVSIGIASLIPARNLEPSDLIAEADAALYEAKEHGRNQYWMAPTSIVESAA